MGPKIIQSHLTFVTVMRFADDRSRTHDWLRPADPDAAGVSPKFDLLAGAYFRLGDGRSQRTAMGTKILGFILYLALSYGVIYLLVSKRFLRGWN